MVDIQTQIFKSGEFVTTYKNHKFQLTVAGRTGHSDVMMTAVNVYGVPFNPITLSDKGELVAIGRAEELDDILTVLNFSL